MSEGFPKLPWHAHITGRLWRLWPRCRAKSAGLRCERRLWHSGPHTSDWRIWDKHHVYQDRMGRLMEGDGNE